MTSSMLSRAAALGSLALATTGALAAFTFDDLDFWVGDGQNRAAIVIDWNTGPDPVSLAWGFRWDGSATGQDMLLAVATADPRLYLRLASFGFGDAIVGMGYDLDGDGFAISDGTDFGPTGVAFAGVSDGATATDPDDHYAEGWNTAFWSYWLGNSAPFDGGTWDGALVGFGDRLLSDGDWDGWRFAPGFVSDAPRQPAPAVPASAGLVVLAVAGLVARRR